MVLTLFLSGFNMVSSYYCQVYKWPQPSALHHLLSAIAAKSTLVCPVWGGVTFLNLRALYLLIISLAIGELNSMIEFIVSYFHIYFIFILYLYILVYTLKLKVEF